MRVWVLMLAVCLFSAKAGERWWPTQAVPEAVVSSRADFPGPRRELDFLLQSISGLAAKSLNTGKGRELLWVETRHPDLDDWRKRWLTNHPAVRIEAALGPWDLVDRFAKAGAIKGYVLFRLDQSKGELNEHRPKMDLSVNVATSLAGILDGIIVEEGLENEAKARGLKLLADARDKTQSWCFQAYRDHFNRRMVCAQDPKKPHARDLAIAHKAFTFFGNDAPARDVLSWLEPLSPVIGWNGGDEFETTDLSSRFGHIQTATDWCMNLPVLMAGSENWTPTKQSSTPAINSNPTKNGVSFVITDGDNVQWLQGNFFRHPHYWGNPKRGTIPFGWSVCFAQLAQLAPQTIDYAYETRTSKDSFIEWGGGYYYPDRFGMDRPNRWQLLAEHARRTWALMRQTGTRMIGFNVHRFDSADARKAYEVLAAQTDGLLGILVFQYAPYEAGAGAVYWVKDRAGREIPVITARYSIWENSNNRPRAGTPAKIAREIQDAKSPPFQWTICHAWSHFRSSPGSDESAENLDQSKATAANSTRGYLPAVWCAERINPPVNVTSPEEMIDGLVTSRTK